MRGKGAGRGFGGGLTRITPAYAGKRASAPASVPASLDHPRICGEKFF